MARRRIACHCRPKRTRVNYDDGPFEEWASRVDVVLAISEPSAYEFLATAVVLT